MRSFLFFLLSCFSLSYADFIQSPWLGNFLQFHFRPSFQYQHYTDVSRSYNPSRYSSHDRFTNLDVAVAFLPTWDFQAGLELADTKKQSLGAQSAAIQARYQWLNDIVGDPVSLTTGLQIRWVNHRSLKDVSCVYSSGWNFEAIAAIGKEFAQVSTWFFRTFGALGLGQGSQGQPYLTSILAFESRFLYHHRLELFLDGYFGFGRKRQINISDFRGYGSIFHQSIDLGVGYHYFINEVFGSISIDYSYRLLAKAFPKNVNAVMVRYDFPFSFF